MNSKQLKDSLVFPVIAVISGIFWFIIFRLAILTDGDVNPAIPVICGGILSVFLTVKFQIDTSRYFKVRMIFFIVSLLTFTFPVIMMRFMPYSANLYNFLFQCFSTVTCIVFVSELICFIKMRLIKKPKELIVILLSDVLTGDLVMLVMSLFIAMNNI